MASDAEHTTVHVKNISPQTSEAQVRDFFSFCGKISNLSVSKDGETQSAAVTFEKPTAAKTALLLDNTQLGPNLVHVTAAASLEELSSPKTAEAGQSTQTNDVPQEDKPRSRIVAEYLAHGYTISDKAIERAISLDKQHGVSTKFTSALSQWDQKLKASERAKGVDTQYGISDKAGQGMRSFHSYFEKALGSPTGQRVRTFYMDTSKQVMDVHQEARRLADMKAGKPTPEQAHMEKIPGTEKTHCNCGGSTGACPCEPGQCACASCPKNTEQPSHSELVERMNMEKIPGTDNTKCSCGGAEGTCPCEPGKCRCANCNKNPEKGKAAEASQGPTVGTPATQ